MLHGMYSQLCARVTPALWRHKPAVIAVLLGAGLAIPSAQADTQTAVATSNDQQACYVDGLSEQMQCGSISVPENYAKPNGKQIQIHYVVMPSTKPINKSEALLAIAGGPGQSAIENAKGFDRMLSKVRQTEDVILIDQRGTGQSNPLQCIGDGFESALAVNESDFDTRVETQKCLDELDADVTQYGSYSK